MSLFSFVLAVLALLVAASLYLRPAVERELAKPDEAPGPEDEEEEDEEEDEDLVVPVVTEMREVLDELRLERDAARMLVGMLHDTLLDMRADRESDRKTVQMIVGDLGAAPSAVPAVDADRESAEELTVVAKRPQLATLPSKPVPPDPDRLRVFAALGVLGTHAGVLDLASEVEAARLIRLGRAGLRTVDEIVELLCEMATENHTGVDRLELLTRIQRRVLFSDDSQDTAREAGLPPEPASAPPAA